MKTECPEGHNQIFEVILKEGRIVDHTCIYFITERKACMASNKVPYPICPLYGKIWNDKKGHSNSPG